jgi:hypothetical protein
MHNTIRPASEADCLDLAPRLRLADVMEIQASGGRTPLEALLRSRQVSTVCLVACTDGRPFAMFGVAPTALPEVASIWMLGSDEIAARKLWACRQARRIVESWHDDYPILFNYVDERNTVHIDWLRWLGAVFIKRHSRHGIEQTPFLEFVKIRNHPLTPCVNQPQSP